MALTSCVLEVERKFRSLAVRELTRHGGNPHFKSLYKRPTKTIKDAYYDRSDILSSAGAWIRKRNGQWQAKIRMGGNYTNSRFEELRGAHAIAGYIERLTGVHDDEEEAPREDQNFGLSLTAAFVTERQTWIADDEFHIVLDTMDFGYQVGEVELQQDLRYVEGSPPSEQRKQQVMQEMDDKIVSFMSKYAWAFTPGETKGKLTVYFERFASA